MNDVLELIIDESGHLHPNNGERYFVVGGYITQPANNTKLKRVYKKVDKELKKQKGLGIKTELKSTHMNFKDKHYFFNKINEIQDVTYVFMVVDKKYITRGQQENINLFYNYAIYKLVHCLSNIKIIHKDIRHLKIKADSRSIKVGSQNGLADYINTQVLVNNNISRYFKTSCAYIDSSSCCGIQTADLLCNTVWTKFNYPQTDKVSTCLDGINHMFKMPLSLFGK